MQHTLLLGVALTVATALIFLAVGNRVGARPVRGDDQLANQMFAVWWWALGALTGVGALINLAAAVGYTDLMVHIALTIVFLLLLCVSLWALGFYLVYLFTGKRNSIYPLGIFYLAYFAVILWLLWQGDPTGVAVGRWSASVVYAGGPLAGESATLYLLFLVAPQVVGGIAYFSLFFRVEDPSQKYRIAMIAGSIVIWFGSWVVASAVGFSQTDLWHVVSRLLALTAACIVYLAFRPIGWVQRRYGIESVTIVLVPTMVHRRTSAGRKRRRQQAGKRARAARYLRHHRLPTRVKRASTNGSQTAQTSSALTRSPSPLPPAARLPRCSGPSPSAPCCSPPSSRSAAPPHPSWT